MVGQLWLVEVAEAVRKLSVQLGAVEVADPHGVIRRFTLGMLALRGEQGSGGVRFLTKRCMSTCLHRQEQRHRGRRGAALGAMVSCGREIDGKLVVPEEVRLV